MCVCVQLGYIVSMHAGSELRTNHLEFVVQVSFDGGTMAVQWRYNAILSGSTIPCLAVQHPARYTMSLALLLSPALLSSTPSTA